MTLILNFKAYCMEESVQFYYIFITLSFYFSYYYVCLVVVVQ